MTIEIPLTRGQVAIVDDEDADLALLNWHAHFIKFYANGGAFMARRMLYNKGNPYSELMHRVIMSRMLDRPLLTSELVDHRHGNPLLNIRSELRLATSSQNNQNAPKRADNTSGYKGVSWHRGTGKWRARIQANGEQVFLGFFATPEEAHEAYKKAASKYHGEFARFE